MLKMNVKKGVLHIYTNYKLKMNMLNWSLAHRKVIVMLLESLDPIRTERSKTKP